MHIVRMHYMLRIQRALKICPCLNRSFRRHISSQVSNNLEIARIRNLGILAHIDAGKTTTTERMLYYSGMIGHPGEVHHGNTVTDYMSQERERGITIKSAVISFKWKDHQFNLIDTPGHIDFTMEVEQTLMVLDGAVVILDGSAGVEAQTVTVWRQADRYQIPRIVYINKMDRNDSSLTMCLRSIEDKLELPTLCLQLPVIESGKLTGVVDLVGMKKVNYCSGVEKRMQVTELRETEEPKLWEEALTARSAMVDELSIHDDELANKILALDSLDKVKETDVTAAIRQTVLNNKAVPVLMGSSYKNMGVEPLMDAVVNYLPHPIQKNSEYSCWGKDLCGKVFKVIHDRHRGPLAFVRLYNGEISKGQKVYNMQLETSEKTGRLYNAYADDFVETELVTNGNIAVVAGLKETMSGNYLTTSNAAVQRVKKKMDSGGEKRFESLFRAKVQVPEPVFFRSIEPATLAHQNKLENALLQLQREDPSLKVRYDTETGQTILAGMGELHLEIIKDRLMKEHKVEVELGPLQIAYRETPLTRVKDKLVVENKIGKSRQMVHVVLSLIPTDGDCSDKLVRLDKSQEAASNIATIFPKHLLAIQQGIEVGLTRGPKIHSQVVNAEVMLHWLEVGRGTSETVIAAAASQLVQKLLEASETCILEPVMSLEIVLPEHCCSIVLADLGRRRATINNITVRRNNKVIMVEVPLAELLGYSTFLRILTSGTATFTMQFHQYQRMASHDEQKAISSVRGF